jgi:hypothetical protein
VREGARSRLRPRERSPARALVAAVSGSTARGVASNSAKAVRAEPRKPPPANRGGARRL